MGEKTLSSPSKQQMNCLFILCWIFYGAIMFKLLVAGGQASSMTPNLTNELMAIKVKNFKTVGEKTAFH